MKKGIIACSIAAIISLAATLWRRRCEPAGSTAEDGEIRDAVRPRTTARRVY